MKKPVALAGILVCCAHAECLRMRVRDPAGLPVARAIVKMGATTTHTDAAGTAELCGLSPGRHSATIHALEFAQVTVIVEAPGERIVTLSLGPRVESPVVVTGTPEPKELAEVDRSITVIPVENAIGPGTWLTDLLKMDASVDVRERGVDGTQADVGIRGGSFSQTLVLVDGIRVNDPQSGHHNMDLPLSVESVSRMEVLRGSGSTLYGSDAVGGAINVITRRPETAELKLTSGIGDFGWNREAASGAFLMGPWRQHLGVARDFSTGFRTGRDFRNLATSAQAFVDEPFGVTSVLFAYNDRPFGAAGFYGAFPSWEKTGTTLLAATQTVGRHRFRFSYRRHRDHYVLYRDQPEAFQNLHTSGLWSGAYTFHHTVSAQMDLTGGFDALSESIASTNLGDHRRGRGSGFVVLQARPSATVNVTAGLRHEIYRRWRSVTSPSLSAGVRFGNGFKARAAVGHAFRVPSYTELYYNDPANRGSHLLRPESAWTYEAGMDWWPGRGAALSATWFERRERETIDFVRPDGDAIWQAMNFHRLNFHGGEIAFRQRVGRAEFGAGYTILRASRRLTPGVASRYVFNFPRSSLALTGAAPLGRYALVRSRIGVFNRAWHSSVGLWDFSLAAQTRRIQPFFQVTNLLNTFHEAFPGLAQPGRWIRGGLQIELAGGTR